MFDIGEQPNAHPTGIRQVLRIADDQVTPKRDTHNDSAPECVISSGMVVPLFLSASLN